MLGIHQQCHTSFLKTGFYEYSDLKKKTKIYNNTYL
jgi:hypothetical protein